MTTTPTPSRRARLTAAAVAAAGLAGAALLTLPGPAGAVTLPVPKPIPGQCSLVDFRTATVDPLASPDPAVESFHLTVTGVLNFPAKVTLEPLVYIRQPEHWGIEVRACPAPVVDPGPIMPRNSFLPIPPPFRVYKATLDFRGPMGTCGIEVIGTNTRQTFDLAGPKACGEIGPVA